MSIATVVSRGYGSFGSIASVVVRGYGAFRLTPEVPLLGTVAIVPAFAGFTGLAAAFGGDVEITPALVGRARVKI